MIKIYSTPTCVYCVKAEEYFKNKGLSYEKIDVTEDEKALDLIIRETGSMAVPVIQIDNNFISGFNKVQLDKLCK